MDELTRIGLISRVCSELDNHLGFSDKTLAEFILHLASIHSSAPAFHKALAENGAEVPMTFAENLLRIIRTMTAPKKTLLNTVKQTDSLSNTASKKEDFSGLRIQNTAAVPLDDLPRELTDAELKKYQREKELNSRQNNNNGHPSSSSSSSLQGKRKDRRSRSPSPAAPSRKMNRPNNNGEVELYGIYDGKVTNILEFGCFVELQGFVNKKEGLVHVAQVHAGNNRDIKQFVRRGQSVKVKVISIAGSKLALSMKEVDQSTGEDLLPQRSKEGQRREAHPSSQYGDGVSDYSNPAPPSSYNNNNRGGENRGIDMRKIREKELEEESRQRRVPKRLTSPELWEARQLINSGVLPISEYPNFDSEYGNGVLGSTQTEEDIEIEISDAEPVFLRGQTKLSRELSPVRIVKNPDGSLQRAALHQSQLSKDRRELKQAQTNNLIDAIPKDLSKPWEDPMPESGDRHFAQELRSINMGGSFELPEWKAKTQGKGISYGQISTRSIKEQRESLPIYRLRTELCAAIAQNQVLVVIGETGSGENHDCSFFPFFLSFCLSTFLYFCLFIKVFLY